MKQLTLDPSNKQPPIRDHQNFPSDLPDAKEIKVPPQSTGGENASLFFIGTATTIIEWEGVRILTDPNFLHAGDHVHLGPGVTSTRVTNPAIDLHEVPHIDAILLSHYHADHFDQEVEASLRRSVPIITTPHAKEHLTSKGEQESFTQVYDLDFFDSMLLNIKTKDASRKPAIKVTGMPGKHVPPGPLSVANDILSAGPPRRHHSSVTEDASVDDLTIPIHYDDYEAFLSPLSDFKKAVEEAGFNHKAVYLDRKDQFRFKVNQGQNTTVA